MTVSQTHIDTGTTATAVVVLLVDLVSLRISVTDGYCGDINLHSTVAGTELIRWCRRCRAGRRWWPLHASCTASSQTCSCRRHATSGCLPLPPSLPSSYCSSAADGFLPLSCQIKRRSCEYCPSYIGYATTFWKLEKKDLVQKICGRRVSVPHSSRS